MESLERRLITDVLYSSTGEKNREQSRRMCICFVDLEKTFDSVPREALWVITVRIGCTENFVRLLRLLHDDMQCCVALESEHQTSYPLLWGEASCVLARVGVSLTPRLTAESELQLQHSICALLDECRGMRVAEEVKVNFTY
ncbi:uncharacterized protein [Choristoneura fumiferana]|uniref:uncharacterized protein n=1 Tax=Choristoneura fumiferana TaxID=7141 RepID=UPI003D158B9B